MLTFLQCRNGFFRSKYGSKLFALVRHKSTQLTYVYKPYFSKVRFSFHFFAIVYVFRVQTSCSNAGGTTPSTTPPGTPTSLPPPASTTPGGTTPTPGGNTTPGGSTFPGGTTTPSGIPGSPTTPGFGLAPTGTGTGFDSGSVKLLSSQSSTFMLAAVIFIFTLFFPMM